MQRKLDKQTKLISETEKEYLQQSNSLRKTEEKRRDAETVLQIHQSLPVKLEAQFSAHFF